MITMLIVFGSIAVVVFATPFILDQVFCKSREAKGFTVLGSTPKSTPLVQPRRAVDKNTIRKHSPASSGSTTDSSFFLPIYMATTSSNSSDSYCPPSSSYDSSSYDSGGSFNDSSSSSF